MNFEVRFCLLRSRPVSGDNYLFARERIAELIGSAHTAVGQIQSQRDDADSALFKATWTTSRAAGFLEAFALVDPALAGDMLADFESVARLVDQLRAPGQPGEAWSQISPAHDAPLLGVSAYPDGSGNDRRLAARPAGNIRRVGVRRSTAERRIDVWRQLSDRLGK